MTPPPTAGDELASAGSWLETHPDLLEIWLREHASTELIERVQQALLHTAPSTRRTSITSDLFQLWLAASPAKSDHQPQNVRPRRDLDSMDEGELFMELIRDVANELDIDVLCHKILVNVCLLTHADRGSLFLAKGLPNDRYLSAKLFDVRHDTGFEEAIKQVHPDEYRIPFGVGIAGTVAQRKALINIKDAYNDPRFSSEIDLKTGYKTKLILCMPICNYEGDVIGVAQIINKTDNSQEFSHHDVEVFERYLTFCGIGIQNAQLFEISVLEYRRNQILLNLARSIFEEQNNLECLVTKIMKEAQDLLKCDRCAVYLLDLNCCEASHLEQILKRPDRLPALISIEDSNKLNDHLIIDNNQNSKIDKFCTFQTVFELRATGTQTLVSRPSSFDLKTSTLAQIASYTAYTGKILNIPDVEIWLKENRNSGDAEAASTILCMPIVNGQKNIIGVAQLINKANGVPFTECDISLFEAFAIFCGLGIHNTQMYESACKLMAKQKVALECLSYHATASNEVTEKLSREEIPSAKVYNLYNFTFIDFDLTDDDTCKAVIRMFMECNLVQQFHIPYEALSPDDYRTVMKVVETAILSTDLAMYFKKRNKFLELVENGEFDWQSEDKKELLCGMMMTACDVSAIAKPWDVQHRVAKMVADEFFDQGDLEKLQLKEQPVAMMDRERKDELPQMQVGFIDVICLPLYRVLSETFPWVKPLYQETLENRKHWQDLAEKVEMGLTWIDHDTIDKPVEAITDPEETKDIELTVQTLHTVPPIQPHPHLDHKLKRKHKLCCIL
ncbi:hypothetical protein FQA39_LY14313 [Lamprigera yunnana]|nr:hypothetical protein FQA39_LY14313 [Lamprigera yunnana]